MKYYQFLLTLILSMSFPGLLSAQNAVTGRVTDKSGNPIVGARVTDKNGIELTTTDPNGEFSINSDRELGKLKFEYMGMLPKTQKVKSGMQVRMSNISWWTGTHDSYHWFVTAQVAIPTSNHVTPAFGLMGGRVKDWGWYVKGVYNPQQSTDGEINYGYYPTIFTTGKVKSNYMAFTGGGIRRLPESPMYLYAGVGYFNHKASWELVDGDYAKYDDDSEEGVAVDFGLLVIVGHFQLSGGAIINVDSFGPAANFGIGYVF